MLKKISLAAIAILLCFANSFAQTDSLRIKKANHFVGVQINELIKQIFNFDGSNNSVIDNPYLLRYSCFFVKSKWALHTGVGFRFNSIDSKEANNETKVSATFYRVGGMRKSMIGKRLEVCYGIDYAGEYKNDVTTSNTVVDFGSGIDSTYSKVTSKTMAYGGGAHLELSVYITPRLLIGTETNYYFMKSVEKENTFISETFISFFSGTTETTISNLNDKVERQEFAITVPVAFFLTVKF